MGEVTKAIWVYIKKNKLSKGRTITPDAKLKKVLPSASFSMFKMPGMLSKHIKWVRGREHEASQSHAQRSRSTCIVPPLPGGISRHAGVVAFSGVCHFRHVDVRLPHRRAVGF